MSNKLIIYTMCNSNFAGDTESVRAIANQLSARSTDQTIRIEEQQDDDAEAIQHLKTSLNEFPDHTQILLISGTHGLKFLQQAIQDPEISELISNKKLIVSWSGHQAPKELQSLEAYLSVVSLVQESINPSIQDTFGLRLVPTAMVSNSLTFEKLEVAINAWHKKNPDPENSIPPSENGYIGVFLGGDAPDENDKQKLYTAEEAREQGRIFGLEAQKTGKILLVTNGPRMRQEVSAAFVEGVNGNGLTADQYRFFNFRPGNSAYQAIIAALYKYSEHSLAFYSADSISYAEIGYFIPYTYAFEVGSTSNKHKAILKRFMEELHLVGKAELSETDLKVSDIDQTKKQATLESGLNKDAANIAGAILNQAGLLSTQTLAPGPLIVSLEGFEISDRERELLAHPRVGGIVLFARNWQREAENPKTLLKQLISEIRTINPNILIMVDHEGGQVWRFRQSKDPDRQTRQQAASEYFTPLPSAKTLGTLYDTNPEEALKKAYELGYTMAKELLECGLHCSLAPVLDIDGGSEAISKYDRALHKNPIIAALIAEQLILGMRAAGMPATGKHFPGHGTCGDSHIKRPTDDRSAKEIGIDAYPFYNLIEKKLLGAVMPAHVIYTAIDPAYTAGFSRIWIQEVLRQQSGFTGVVMSDCLSMEGANMGSQLGGILAAHAAGCDFYILANQHGEKLESLIGILDEIPDTSESAGRRLGFAQQCHPAQQLNTLIEQFVAVTNTLGSSAGATPTESGIPQDVMLNVYGALSPSTPTGTIDSPPKIFSILS